MEYVARALVTINTAGGQFLLEDVSDLKVSAPKNNAAVKTMNRLNRVRGHRAGPAEVTATWTVQNALVKDVSLHNLWRSGEVFLMSWEEGPGDGERFQLTGVKIDDIQRSYNADGEATMEVSLVATDLVQTA